MNHSLGLCECFERSLFGTPARVYSFEELRGAWLEERERLLVKTLSGEFHYTSFRHMFVARYLR